MAELTAAPDGIQVVTPAPRPLWRRLLDADTDALADHGPEWIDAMCDDGRYVDASRLYELPDGRRFVLPLTRRRGMAGAGGWLACHPPAWGHSPASSWCLILRRGSAARLGALSGVGPPGPRVDFPIGAVAA